METILLVNHQDESFALMADTAREMGFICLTAAGPDEALALLDRHEVDLVICDLHPPGMDGLSFMSRARDVLPESAFILITGFSGEYSYEKIILSGADDFIRKPITALEFGNKLKRVLGHYRLQKQNRQLLKEQGRLNQRLSALLELSSDLTSELDVDRLFPLIIGKVTDAMKAERTSLYVIDWEARELWTKVAEQIEDIRLPLGQGISGRVAELGEEINVRDAWELPYFNREFDRKHLFRTRSVLCLPIKNQPGEMIGVIQVINKQDPDYFDREDEHFLKGLASQVGIALDNSLLHDELRLSFESSIRALSATVDARHPLTAGHSQRVTEYTLLIAREMGLGSDDLEIYKYAALLHDIGKIGIADCILLKNGPFTPEEREAMNDHTVKTRNILDKFHFPRSLKQVPQVAAHHHEKFNGRGYPTGLAGTDIPLGSRIMAVADVFDALTSKRDYPKYDGDQTMNRDPMPVAKAVSILEKDAGSHFDPEVVQAFIGCLPRALRLFRGSHFPPAYVDDEIARHEGQG